MSTNTTFTDEQFQKFMAQLQSQLHHKEAFHFCPQDLGYFDPDDDTELFVETVDNKTVYHNVFSFTSCIRAKCLEGTEGQFAASTIALYLDQCLKGKAELWYTNEISNTTRAGLKATIENWCTELEIRFRISPGIALEKLEKLRYTIDDVRRRKDPEEFVQKIMVLGRSTDIINSEYAQMLIAHCHLSAELRIHIPSPTPETSFTTFMKQLNQKKDDWFDIWRSNLPDQRPTSQNQQEVKHFPSHNVKQETKEESKLELDNEKDTEIQAIHFIQLIPEVKKDEELQIELYNDQEQSFKLGEAKVYLWVETDQASTDQTLIDEAQKGFAKIGKGEEHTSRTIEITAQHELATMGNHMSWSTARSRARIKTELVLIEEDLQWNRALSRAFQG